jgi:hypothetical protein
MRKSILSCVIAALIVATASYGAFVEAGQLAVSASLPEVLRTAARTDGKSFLVLAKLTGTLESPVLEAEDVRASLHVTHPAVRAQLAQISESSETGAFRPDVWVAVLVKVRRSPKGGDLHLIGLNALGAPAP